MIGWLAAWNSTLQLIFRIWDWMSGWPMKKLIDRRHELEEESRIALIAGDLEALRRVRAQLEEVDRRIRTRDFA